MDITLCHTDDIPEGGARGFDLDRGNLFAVKRRGVIHLYLNRCPHLGLPLEWEPHQFLDAQGLYVKCANHGAFFVPETGECIQGPCLGDALWAVDYTIRDAKVVIAAADLPAPHGPA